MMCFGGGEGVRQGVLDSRKSRNWRSKRDTVAGAGKQERKKEPNCSELHGLWQGELPLS